jgi:hypothetical protein
MSGTKATCRKKAKILVHLMPSNCSHISPATIKHALVQNKDGPAEPSFQAAFYSAFNGLLPTSMICLFEVGKVSYGQQASAASLPSRPTSHIPSLPGEGPQNVPATLWPCTPFMSSPIVILLRFENQPIRRRRETNVKGILW